MRGYRGARLRCSQYVGRPHRKVFFGRWSVERYAHRSGGAL